MIYQPWLFSFFPFFLSLHPLELRLHKRICSAATFTLACAEEVSGILDAEKISLPIKYSLCSQINKYHLYVEH